MTEVARPGFGHSTSPFPVQRREAPDCTARHCWVHAPSLPGGRVPWLLVEWSGDSGWQGRVVYPWLVDGRWVVVEAWLPAAQVSRR